jgi:hypothetical protein
MPGTSLKGPWFHFLTSSEFLSALKPKLDGPKKFQNLMGYQALCFACHLSYKRLKIGVEAFEYTLFS